MSISVDLYKFETLVVTSPKLNVLLVEMNGKGGLMNAQMWKEVSACFNRASDDEIVRVVLLTGAGSVFTNGLDIEDVAPALAPKPGQDAARTGFNIYKLISIAQECPNAIERCMKPVIAAINGACIGGGMDVITACDIRMCAQDAIFSVKELDFGIAQDMGALQRLPRIIGSDSLVRDLCFTGRDMDAKEALACGLVSKLLPNSDELKESALNLASLIAKRSPIGVQGSKVNLNFCRNNSVHDSLQFVRSWNATMLQTEDIGKALSAKSPDDAEFGNL